jgi:hypothetical protein
MILESFFIAWNTEPSLGLITFSMALVLLFSNEILIIDSICNVLFPHLDLVIFAFVARRLIQIQSNSVITITVIMNSR